MGKRTSEEFADDTPLGKRKNSGSAEDSEDDMLMDDVDDAEKLSIDFEACAIDESDKESIINLLTQIFLRADVDVGEMAANLAKQSPFGCIYKPAEEFVDDEDEMAYGVLSMLELGNKENYQKDIWNLLKTRARKYAPDKNIVCRLNHLSSGNIRVGLLINERLLNFPAAIAAPAFKSLKDDLKTGGSMYCFESIILVLKVRIADQSHQASNSSTGQPKKGKDKMSKAAKRRAAANACADFDVVYDNPEEALLFQGNFDFEYFQYPVQSEVEKESKFNALVLKGVTYRPYRRVCILNNSEFHQFIDLVSGAEGV